MKHECDCGRVFSDLDSLYACQNSRHGADHIATATQDIAEIAKREAEISRLSAALMAIERSPRGVSPESLRQIARRALGIEDILAAEMDMVDGLGSAVHGKP